MSDNKKFKRWLDKTGRSEHGFMSFVDNNHCYQSAEIGAEEAWDYQQKIIDAKNKEIERLKKELKKRDELLRRAQDSVSSVKLREEIKVILERK